MVGVLMSSKTLAGQVNKWPGRFPTRENAGWIFSDDNHTLNLIHYSTDSPENLLEEMISVTQWGGPRLHGLQLNIAWPSETALGHYFKECPGKTIVLQIGKAALAWLSGSSKIDPRPEEVADQVARYEGLVDSILIDSSGGRGEPFEGGKAIQILSAIQKKCPSMGLGIAGGLGPNLLSAISVLKMQFPNLSWDAEGKLRTPKPEDALDMTAVRQYLKQSFSLCHSKK